MSNLTVKQSALPALSMEEGELMQVLQSSLYPGAAVSSIKMVLGYCRASGLDPMQKPVHIVPMWDSKSGQMRDVVMPGVGLYRTQAARSGCAGVSEPDFGPDVTEEIGGVRITFPSWCRATVKRRLETGEIVEFTAREFWKENYAVKGGKEKSVAPNAMWTKRPYGQLAKCAEAQALRKAFPEVGSQPTADEMEGKAIDTIDVSTGEITPQKPTEPAFYSAEEFDQKFEGWAKPIREGKPAERVIAFAESRGGKKFTAEQRAKIMAVKAQEAQSVQDVEPKEPKQNTEQSTEQFLAELEGN